MILASLFIYVYLYVNVSEVIKNAFTSGLDKKMLGNTLGNGTNFSRILAELNESLASEGSLKAKNISMLTNKSSSMLDFKETLITAIAQNKSKRLLTLFTTWVSKVSKYVVYNNTINNWIQLKPFVRLVIFTNESNVASYCLSQGWGVLPVTASAIGVPILKKMYMDVIARFDSFFYAFSNGDILYTDSLINTLLLLLGSPHIDKPMLVVGVRTNVKNVSKEEAKTFQNITSVAKKRGKVFQVYAEDYFITTKSYPWKDIPPVVIGRPAYDNWLVLNARKKGHLTIDVTRTVLAVHQTTKAGDYEGHGNKNKDFNSNLLAKLYKRVHYNAGGTYCCTFLTKYAEHSIPKLFKQEKIPKACFPI